METKRRKD